MKITLQNKKDSLKALEKYSVYKYAKSMLDKVSFSKKSSTVAVEVITPRDLGFTEYLTFSQFIDKIKFHPKYELCQPQDGIALRIAYKDQPKGEWIRIAMETIPGSDGGPYLFYVGHDYYGVWLDSHWYDPTSTVDLDYLWAVRLRDVSDFVPNILDSDLESRLLTLEKTVEKLTKIINI